MRASAPRIDVSSEKNDRSTRTRQQRESQEEQSEKVEIQENGEWDFNVQYQRVMYDVLFQVRRKRGKLSSKTSSDCARSSSTNFSASQASLSSSQKSYGTKSKRRKATRSARTSDPGSTNSAPQLVKKRSSKKLMQKPVTAEKPVDENSPSIILNRKLSAAVKRAIGSASEKKQQQQQHEKASTGVTSHGQKAGAQKESRKRWREQAGVPRSVLQVPPKKDNPKDSTATQKTATTNKEVSPQWNKQVVGRNKVAATSPPEEGIEGKPAAKEKAVSLFDKMNKPFKKQAGSSVKESNSAAVSLTHEKVAQILAAARERLDSTGTGMKPQTPTVDATPPLVEQKSSNSVTHGPKEGGYIPRVPTPQRFKSRQSLGLRANATPPSRMPRIPNLNETPPQKRLMMEKRNRDMFFSLPTSTSDEWLKRRTQMKNVNNNVTSVWEGQSHPITARNKHNTSPVAPAGTAVLQECVCTLHL